MNYRKLLFFSLRFLAYALVMAVLYLIFKYDATHFTGDVKITENSMTEIFQEIIVFMVAVGFFVSGRMSKELTPVSNLLALLFLMSFVREFNNQIDYWSYIVAPILLVFLFLFVRNFKKNLAAFEQFIDLRSSGAFFIGFLITYVFSRFFGKTSFWMALLGDAYNRTAKNMAEEGIELLGYSIMLISVVELLVYLQGKSKKLKVKRQR